MTDYIQDLEFFRAYELSGAWWCRRRHRWIVRIRYHKKHAGVPEYVICRTASEAAAYVNAARRALLENPPTAKQLNDFAELFRNGRTTEGPEMTGCHVLMIEAPFCWIKVTGSLSWLFGEEWFFDPVTGKPSRVKLRQAGGVWRWEKEALDLVVWQSLGREGLPFHVNGDELDCRVENLSATAGGRTVLERPLMAARITVQENVLVRMLKEYLIAVMIDSDRLPTDPWEPPLFDEIEGRMVPRHSFEEGDRRWMVETARRLVPEILDLDLWKGRAELIRMMGQPWTINWGDRRRQRASRPGSKA